MTATTLARTSDPITSKMAVPSVETRMPIMFRLLDQFAKKSMPSEEAADKANLLHTGYWKRVSDLANRGWIEERRQSGGKIMTVLASTGKQVIVWRITPSGRTALRERKAAAKKAA